MGAEECVTLPTPTARDGKGQDKKKTLLEAKVRLLPTPNTAQSPNGHGMRGGRAGNGHQSGKDLEATVKLLPTPTAAIGTGGQTSRSGDRKGEKLLTGIVKSIGSTMSQRSGDGSPSADS